MRVGYGRTSSLEQVAGLEAQERDLKAAGCEKVFVEQISATAAKRPQLEAAIAFAREGDEFCVKRLDRLARSVADLVEIEKRLRAKGVSFRTLDGAIETATPTGRLMFNIIGSIAQFERELMLERQKEGVAKAKAEGRYKGRKPTARAKADIVLARRASGDSPTVIAKALKISPASVYRIFGDAEAAANLHG